MRNVSQRIRRLAKKHGMKASYWSENRCRHIAQEGWHFVDPSTKLLLTGEYGMSDEEALEYLFDLE